MGRNRRIRRREGSEGKRRVLWRRIRAEGKAIKVRLALYYKHKRGRGNESKAELKMWRRELKENA